MPTASTLIKDIDELAIKSSTSLKEKYFNDEKCTLEISLSREDVPRFIRKIATEINCPFSVSTPSLEEILRVKFKEFL
ncbi:hypothetical protein [Bartonella massiliensis]|uniref:hypothetical protein n=1 Tax=Bartonella massiliensis TaxID=929795 RepID=UPI001FE86DF2|nr:hypothetical protein [Bartonella massiliensis]